MPWIIAAMAGLFVAALFTWIGVNLWFAYINHQYDDGITVTPTMEDYAWVFGGIVFGIFVLGTTVAL